MVPVYIAFDKNKKEIILFSNNIDDIKPFYNNKKVTCLKATKDLPIELLKQKEEKKENNIINFLKRKKQNELKDNLKVIVNSYFVSIKNKYPTLNISEKIKASEKILLRVLPNYKENIEEELKLINKKEISNKLKGVKRRTI